MALLKEWRWLLLSIILLALLGWMATLQYRGIASITLTERERLQWSAEARAAEMSRAFDSEIAQAYAAFYRPLGNPGGTDPALNAAQMYARFKATARHPRLIREVFLLKFGNGEQTLQRIVPGAPAEPATWPQEFAAWVPRFKGTTSVPGSGVFVLVDVPALMVPVTSISVLMPPSKSGAAMSGSFSFSGILFEWLDRDYLEHEFIPALVNRFFASRDGFNYNVAVISPKEKNRVVYVSDKSLPASAFAKADVQATLLQVRLDQVVQATTPAASSASALLRSDPNAGQWQLRLVHKAGSLDRAVAVVRRRNLAVSFAAMVLVALSTGFLVVSTRRAQRLARQQMVFVAGVSHELRTPLTVIRTAGENLSDGVIADPAQVRHYGTVIAEEGQRLTEMVEQVMSFAGFESGRDLSDRTFVGVDQVIDDAAAASRIEESGTRLERKVPPGLPVLHVNAAALTQALGNLFSNAAKYGGDDRWAQVAVRRSSDGRELHIMVSDHGRGIHSDEVRRIFEPFYRSRDVVGTTIRGSGLGLSLAKRIVEAHGGTIAVKSTNGHGATFTVRLPIDVQAAVESQS